jgi:O-methyltransferase
MTSCSDHKLRQSYLELIKRAVTNYLHLGGDAAFPAFDAVDHYDRAGSTWRIDRQAVPMTLLSLDQLNLLERSILDIQTRGIAGDIIEAGVWRGGAVIFMAAVLNAYGFSDRQIIAADSFAGIPQNGAFKHDPVDAWQDRWVATLDEVKANFSRFALSDTCVEFVPGYFSDSLPTLGDRRFALIRLDSDAHDSVMVSLECLYPLLEPGGIIVIDDWHLVGCRFAVNSFREKHGITEPVCADAGNGYWVKSGAPSDNARC